MSLVARACLHSVAVPRERKVMRKTKRRMLVFAVAGCPLGFASQGHLPQLHPIFHLIQQHVEVAAMRCTYGRAPYCVLLSDWRLGYIAHCILRDEPCSHRHGVSILPAPYVPAAG